MDYKDFQGEDDNELWRQAASQFQPLKNKKPGRVASAAQKFGNIKKNTPIKITDIAPALSPRCRKKPDMEF